MSGLLMGEFLNTLLSRGQIGRINTFQIKCMDAQDSQCIANGDNRWGTVRDEYANLLTKGSRFMGNQLWYYKVNSKKINSNDKYSN